MNIVSNKATLFAYEYSYQINMQQLKRLLYLPSRSLLIRSVSNVTYSDVGVYDMVVVGGGMVGLALACAVGKLYSIYNYPIH